MYICLYSKRIDWTPSLSCLEEILLWSWSKQQKCFWTLSLSLRVHLPQICLVSVSVPTCCYPEKTKEKKKEQQKPYCKYLFSTTRRQAQFEVFYFSSCGSLQNTLWSLLTLGHLQAVQGVKQLVQGRTASLVEPGFKARLTDCRARELHHRATLCPMCLQAAGSFS